MGYKLKEIKQVKDMGLVGICYESDKKVKLDIPKPDSLIIHINKKEFECNYGSKNWDNFLRQKDEEAKTKLLNNNEGYFYFEKRNFFETGLHIYLIPYDKYTERE